MYSSSLRFQQNKPKNQLKRYENEHKSVKGDPEAATRDVLQEKVFLEISQNSQENTCVRVSFLIKLQAKKETLAHMFSREFREISKNTFYHRAPLVATSVYLCLNYAQIFEL